MAQTGLIFLCLCVVAGMFQGTWGFPPPDAETRARMEAKAMSSLSLKDLEKMVENDDRIKNIQKESKLIIVPKSKLATGYHDGEERKAYIIHKKPKKFMKKLEYSEPEFLYETPRYFPAERIPEYRYDSFRRYDDETPSIFDKRELETADSSPVKSFYESIVERVMAKPRYDFADPLSTLDFASSDDVPLYRPRFDYDSYARDSTDTKLSGKPYWRGAPERREEKVDDKGCRMVVKKIVDPEDEKKSNGAPVKSVIITKECEYPSIDGPDAKIPEVESQFKSSGSGRLDTEPSNSRDSYDQDSPSYDNSPKTYDVEKSPSREPLEPDYIDKMLETHFRSFPGFVNPITSFKGYQDRFNLRTPEGFKNIKPKISIQSYDYNHPLTDRETSDDHSRVSNDKESGSPKKFEHHYHYQYPEKKEESGDFDKADVKTEGKSPKDPKMMKKSFAYYRKDNPKTDPDDHQYAEEYAQGNYRSFSSDYDSERDGPKKQ